MSAFDFLMASSALFCASLASSSDLTTSLADFRMMSARSLYQEERREFRNRIEGSKNVPPCVPGEIFEALHARQVSARFVDDVVNIAQLGNGLINLTRQSFDLLRIQLQIQRQSLSSGIVKIHSSLLFTVDVGYNYLFRNFLDFIRRCGVVLQNVREVENQFVSFVDHRVGSVEIGCGGRLRIFSALERLGCVEACLRELQMTAS